ncbi:MAG: hypothetical protein FJZ58_01400 [Chlamydiae bacterium]|nr:hypothetical protein [Chlamydiota bacterium]
MNSICTIKQLLSSIENSPFNEGIVSVPCSKNLYNILLQASSFLPTIYRTRIQQIFSFASEEGLLQIHSIQHITAVADRVSSFFLRKLSDKALPALLCHCLKEWEPISQEYKQETIAWMGHQAHAGVLQRHLLSDTLLRETLTILAREENIHLTIRSTPYYAPEKKDCLWKVILCAPKENIHQFFHGIRATCLSKSADSLQGHCTLIFSIKQLREAFQKNNLPKGLFKNAITARMTQQKQQQLDHLFFSIIENA